MRTTPAVSARSSSARPSRCLLALLVLVAAARADLLTDVRRAWHRDDPEQRRVGLQAAQAAIGAADRKARNRAAAEIGKRYREEPAPSVRSVALDVLLALRTERALDRLVALAVTDRVDEVRQHGRDLVRDHADPMLHEAIVRALRDDASWRVRAAMIGLLLAGGRTNARRPLVAALGDTHPAVAARAAEALERLTGLPFGVDAKQWTAFLDKEEGRDEPRGDGTRRTTTAPPRKVVLHDGPIRGVIPTLYTVPIRTKRVIFVVDMSSSMHRTARSSHFTRLKQAIFGLPSDVEFNVLCFDQRMFFFAKAKSLVPADTANKADVERWINDLPAGERTDVNRSVVAGLAMLREALLADDKAEAELFILTDGQETSKSTSTRVVQAQYAKLPVDRCKVHVIALGQHGTPALRVLAEASGGRFVEAE